MGKSRRAAGEAGIHLQQTLRLIAILAITLLIPPLAGSQELPEGEGKKLLRERCAGCHTLKPVTDLKQSREEWKALLVKMVGYGAQLNQEEIIVATEYLTKYFGPGRTASAETAETPEEKVARRYIDGICSSCHDAGLIRSTKATRAEWLDIVNRMNGLDAGVSQRDVDLLVDYLAAKYGPG